MARSAKRSRRESKKSRRAAKKRRAASREVRRAARKARRKSTKEAKKTYRRSKSKCSSSRKRSRSRTVSINRRSRSKTSDKKKRSRSKTNDKKKRSRSRTNDKKKKKRSTRSESKGWQKGSSKKKRDYDMCVTVDLGGSDVKPNRIVNVVPNDSMDAPLVKSKKNAGLKRKRTSESAGGGRSEKKKKKKKKGGLAKIDKKNNKALIIKEIKWINKSHMGRKVPNERYSKSWGRGLQFIISSIKGYKKDEMWAACADLISRTLDHDIDFSRAIVEDSMKEQTGLFASEIEELMEDGVLGNDDKDKVLRAAKSWDSNLRENGFSVFKNL